MTPDRDDIAGLLAEAETLPEGPAKVAVCEEAVALADARRDTAAGFDARLKLVSAACFGGRPDVTMVAYAWVLAAFDADPDRFGWRAYEVLWQYKWVVNAAGQFPEFSRDKCDELLADLSRRFAAFGSTRHPALSAEHGLAIQLADLPRARAVAGKLRRARRDILSDCPACDASGEVAYQTWLGRHAAAVKAADPVLDGELTCKSVPMGTYANLLRPLWELGRLEEAMTFHRRGYRLAAARPTCVGAHADHVEFLVLTDNLARAAQLAGKHLPAAAAACSPANRRQALCVYRLLFDVLADRRARPVRVPVPAGHPLHRPDGKVPVADALEWLDAEARDLAGRFDARNGNGHFTAAIDGHAGLKRRITPHPYSAKPGG